jgi:hypothetical protein
MIILQRGADTWTPYSLVRLGVIENHIDSIVDYAHCPWVIGGSCFRNRQRTLLIVSRETYPRSGGNRNRDEWRRQ